jgi:bacillolysin
VTFVTIQNGGKAVITSGYVRRSALAALGISLAVVGPAQAAPDATLTALTDSGARVGYHRQTGKVSFIGMNAGVGAPLSVPGAGLLPAQESALGYAAQLGPLFGLSDPAKELQVSRAQSGAAKGSVVRLQQVYDGVPVIAGELIVNLDGAGGLRSINGEVSPDLKLSTQPTINGDDATTAAVEAVAKTQGVEADDLKAGKPSLAIYDPRLLSPGSGKPGLVWRLELTSDEAPIREFVVVDAQTGAVRLHFNQVHTALDRETYTADETAVQPGILVCDETDPTCAAGDSDAQHAHVFAGDTYDFYLSHHGRDGIDGAGMAIVSTVHWNDGVSCPNAFWDGTQMVYCTTLSEADDVVGHELTHGVTQYESGLYYYYESGAINESLSDIWGEFVDLTNGAGTDTASVRWQIGEDVSALGGAIRDMADPTVFGDPDRMTSPFYYTLSGDGGGVHTNSGVSNKTAFLLTDGASFNGQTITGLDIDKTAAIFYEAQTHLLTSGSGYRDFANALVQGCQNVIGTYGISSTDCDQVSNAVAATEMEQEPVVGFNPDAVLCPAGQEVAQYTFLDDFETAPYPWLVANLSGANTWGLASGYASSGVISLYVQDASSVSDSTVYNSPAVTLPAGAYLHFKHSYGFESPNFDGSVVEYSTNGGTTWTDLGGLYSAGQNYTGTISTCCSNPLGGRSAFVDSSHGYVSSRYDLSSLGGSNFQVRFREANDNIVAGPLGWLVDDVAIYTCKAAFTNLSMVGLSVSNQTKALFREASTKAASTAVGFGTTLSPVAAANLPDIDESGHPELAVLGTQSGKVKVIVRDAVNRTLVSSVALSPNIAPLALTTLPDMDGNGVTELAALGQRGSDGRVFVQIKDPVNKTLINLIPFLQSDTAIAVAPLPDTDGNGSPELAVLGKRIADGAVRVQLRDALSGANLGTVGGFSSAYDPKALAVLPDINGNGQRELAALCLRTSDGGVRVEVRDSPSGTLVNTIVFDPNYDPQALAVVPDLDGNGIVELAVLGVRADGLARVQMRDAATDAPVNTVGFGSTFSPRGMLGLTVFD